MLKPCPFCGESDKLIVVEHNSKSKAVSCGACGAEGPLATRKDDAKARWNERPGH